ncbi:hypothetical protein EVAR_90019_1 [Eumeta japonica]|uniref:Uncharacterized protein n=1 Tax=Eumeta variegata TaxID=151549 RepID=A0A4C1WTC2_EUMVA|nr:hypothetical protein EVAR_90019_1 [Eumeta japonica]
MRGGYQNFNIFVRVCMDRRFLTRLVQICEHTAARRVTVRPAAFRVPLARTGDASFKCLPYQLSMVVSATTMVVTGNGESGFDSERSLRNGYHIQGRQQRKLPTPGTGSCICAPRCRCTAPAVQLTRLRSISSVNRSGAGLVSVLGVGGAICLVNSGNERDSSLLNRRRHSGVRGVRVARLTGGVIKIFLEGPAASSRTRLSNNRPGNPLKPSCWGLGFAIIPINEEFLVSASHKLALITSLPFVHTARRYYRLNDLVRSSDRHAVALSAVGVAGKLTKLDHLEESKRRIDDTTGAMCAAQDLEIFRNDISAVGGLDVRSARVVARTDIESASHHIVGPRSGGSPAEFKHITPNRAIVTVARHVVFGRFRFLVVGSPVQVRLERGRFPVEGARPVETERGGERDSSESGCLSAALSGWVNLRNSNERTERFNVRFRAACVRSSRTSVDLGLAVSAGADRAYRRRGRRALLSVRHRDPFEVGLSAVREPGDLNSVVGPRRWPTGLPIGRYEYETRTRLGVRPDARRRRVRGSARVRTSTLRACIDTAAVVSDRARIRLR